MRLDLLHLWRSLRRSPASAAAAVLTLSLTIGAGAAIFAVVDAVLLTPPPFEDPDALVIAGETPSDEPAASPRAIRYGTFEAWRERAGALAALEAFDGTNLTLTGLGAAERVSATDVTPGFLPLLGVRPARGRMFDRDDAGQPVAIISDRFWRGKLAADPAVVGRHLVLGGRTHTIVGVLPDRFSFAINACEIWRPLPMAAAEAARSGYRVLVIARLARSTSPAALAAALDDVSRTASPPPRVVATHVATAIAGDTARTLGLLAAAAALATLIAFINLGGLLIVRSIDRRRELAVRSALGARQSDIARQLLLEAGALVVMGTAGGALIAFWMTPALGQLVLAPFGGAANRPLAVSWPVIALVSIVAIGCGCVCGSLPALATARWSVVDILRKGATSSPREVAVRRVFVAGEVAVAFVLLVSMALVGRTLLDVLRVNPGFDPRGVLTLQVSLPAASYPSRERLVSFYSTVQRALRERLGGSTVSVVDELPLTGDRGRSFVSAGPTSPGREAVVRTASPDYFDVMRIPVIAGRTFTWEDNGAAPLRVVISQTLAERLFARESPIGRRIWLAPGGQTADVVGVVGPVKHRALDESDLPTVYTSALQVPSPSSIVVVRSARPDADVIAAVREAVARLDGNLPVYGVRTMQDLVARSPGVPARRLLTAAFTGFAVLAVTLSAIGLFGVAAHDVARRRTELALRIALGADPLRLLCATLGQGAAIVGSGLAAGGVVSMWAARGLSGVVFVTGQSNLLSIAVAATALIATGVAAVLPAALRAARTDPMTALRSE
ncbi:MAG TPA: ADOP family duplicated permease [Vicinamibacterales bacterium]|nr:ADOP family duplicated permease [Vicinamibacterales bacterium]